MMIVANATRRGTCIASRAMAQPRVGAIRQMGDHVSSSFGSAEMEYSLNIDFAFFFVACCLAIFVRGRVSVHKHKMTAPFPGGK
jgi:hypothetical protein